MYRDMGEGQNYSATAVGAWASWAITVVLVVAMWAALWSGHDPLALSFGFTSAVLGAVASTVHIRGFTCRTQNLIRSLAEKDEMRERELFEMGRDSVTELHPLR